MNKLNISGLQINSPARGPTNPGLLIRGASSTVPTSQDWETLYYKSEMWTAE
jgi:hypothetical protein